MADKNPGDEALLSGLSKAAGVFYNYTGDVPCYNYRCGSLTPNAVSPKLQSGDLATVLVMRAYGFCPCPKLHFTIIELN